MDDRNERYTDNNEYDDDNNKTVIDVFFPIHLMIFYIHEAVDINLTFYTVVWK